MPKPRLLAIANHPVWPVTDGYALRVRHLLEELARWWEISAIVPVSATDNGWSDRVPEGAVAIRTVPATGAFDTADPAALRHAVDETIAHDSPDALLLWGGTEWVVFDRPELPPAVGDRIDCMTLTTWRDRIDASGVRAHARVLRQAMAYARYERRALRRLAAMVVVGESDARVLRRLAPGAEVHVVPNGVAVRGIPDHEAESALPTVAFTGVLSHDPNVDAARHFVEEVWPIVRVRVPDARFVIAGRNPVSALRALDGKGGVELHGDVPDMNAVLRNAWVAVAPMRRGAGIKNKVLEAWAAGKPVVMTKIAANGLDVPADDPLVVDEPRQFADRVVGLLRNASERKRLGASLHAHVREAHSWAAAGQRLSALLDGARQMRSSAFGSVRL